MRQTQAVKQAAKGTAEAETFIAEAVDEAVKRTRKSKPETLCTVEDIVRERDERKLSWKQVAVNLGLGSPSGARAAYTRLTGRPHSESAPVLNRATKGHTSVTGERRALLATLWDDDSDQDDIIDAITHKSILVQRTCRGFELPDEWVHVSKIKRFQFEGADECLTVVLYTKENGRCSCQVKDPRDAEIGVARAFRVRDIKQVMK